PIDPIRPPETQDPKLIAWNHRWEYDKNPDLFADAMIALAERDVEFRLALLGQRHRRTHQALARLRKTLPDRIIADGDLSADEYRAMLGRAGIAVSTAIHEFQGLGMLEAASAGCLPLVPDALCYPEIYPSEYRYPSGDREALVDRLSDWLSGNSPPALNVGAWSAVTLEPAWRRALLDEDTRFHEAMGQSRDA
ncbi:MAG TPA: glycosyltransferase, partial [Wenzhouxiangellaceae bacterium]|nr:glycosyltransferase [Wenzhouxiangellaceae bacterium]